MGSIINIIWTYANQCDFLQGQSSFFDYLLHSYHKKFYWSYLENGWPLLAPLLLLLMGLPCQIGDNTGLTHQSLLLQNVTKPIHTLQGWEGTPEAWLHHYHVNTFFDKN